MSLKDNPFSKQDGDEGISPLEECHNKLDQLRARIKELETVLDDIAWLYEDAEKMKQEARTTLEGK